MKESKRTDIKTIVAVVIFLIVAVTLVILTFKKVFDFTTAALIFAVTGVIFYFVFVGINYKHSIYGGRFEDHYGKTDKTIKELPEDQRPDEKCEMHGPEFLADAELLAVIIRTGWRILCRKMPFSSSICRIIIFL